MGRITRDQMLMQMAWATALRGTCSRLQVGAIVSKNGRPIATGYNGAPAGLPHCDHSDDNSPGCQVAEHAERNAIAFAARYGVALEGAEMHVTHGPCLECARSIINAGIIRVTYQTAYRLTAGVELLTQAGIDTVYIGQPK